MASKQYSYQLKIPKDRIAVLIGKEGEVKNDLVKITDTEINIDSEEGDITISGNDTIKLFSLREIITAIGRGFNPEIAKALLKVDYILEVINVNDFAKTKSTSLRLKGRVIGNEGRSRRTLEDLTECSISIYGKTVAIIGDAEHVPLAKHAIESLLKGAPHANVYKWVEKQRNELKKKSIEEEYL